jgi:uncharacterized membrane protein
MIKMSRKHRFPVYFRHGKHKPLTSIVNVVIALGFILGVVIMVSGILMYMGREGNGIPTEVAVNTIVSGLLMFGLATFFTIFRSRRRHLPAELRKI